MAHEGPQEDGANIGSFRTHRGWTPPRALVLVAATTALCAVLVAVTGIIGSSSNPETEAALEGSGNGGVVAGVATEPASSPDEATANGSSTSTPGATSIASAPVFPTPI